MLSSGRFFLQKNSETSSVLTDVFLFWEVRRMKIIMITGFLGSGKTTLMQNILCEYGKSMKAGVIVNDFGKENIDAKLLGEEYCLRGGDSASYGWTENEKNYTGNLLILKDLEKIDMLCDFSESRSGCSGGPNEFYAYSDGKIMLVETILNFKCEISIDSSSSCSDY